MNGGICSQQLPFPPQDLGMQGDQASEESFPSEVIGEVGGAKSALTPPLLRSGRKGMKASA